MNCENEGESVRILRNRELQIKNNIKKIKLKRNTENARLQKCANWSPRSGVPAPDIRLLFLANQKRKALLSFFCRILNIINENFPFPTCYVAYGTLLGFERGWCENVSKNTFGPLPYDDDLDMVLLPVNRNKFIHFNWDSFDLVISYSNSKNKWKLLSNTKQKIPETARISLHNKVKKNKIQYAYQFPFIEFFPCMPELNHVQVDKEKIFKKRFNVNGVSIDVPYPVNAKEICLDLYSNCFEVIQITNGHNKEHIKKIESSKGYSYSLKSGKLINNEENC